MCHPNVKETFPCVITLHGGINRGHEVEDVAVYFANHGLASMALAYFSVDGLPSLYEAPFDLGYFEEAIDLVLQGSIIILFNYFMAARFTKIIPYQQ